MLKFLEGVDRSLVYKLVFMHTVVIALSNYLVQFKFNLFPGADIPFFGEFPLAVAAFTFPIVVVATDLTVRLLGKEAGRAVVALAVIPAIIVSILVVWGGGAPIEKALRIGLGSGAAYGVATMLDVYVFQYIREKFTEMWWAAPAFSTVVANILDTYAFFYTAFYPAPWVHAVALNQSITKIVVGLIVFLPAYGLLLGHLRKKLGHIL
jgi:queuosine precursor transporter